MERTHAWIASQLDHAAVRAPASVRMKSTGAPDRVAQAPRDGERSRTPRQLAGAVLHALGLKRRGPPRRAIRGMPVPWAKLIHAMDVDLVLDVGGGLGQYGGRLRRTGYEGRIVSFEPLDSSRLKLVELARPDRAWEVRPEGLGESDGAAVINVSGNPGSSSLLAMLDAHRAAAPTSAYVATQPIAVRRLDGILREVRRGAARPMLKIDVQGFELAVLRGAGETLREYCLVQLEMSTVPLYAGGPLRDDIERFLETAGFEIAGVLQGFSDPETGRMLQLDGLFARRDLLP
jgi:FkbM family methyltransferase